MEKTTKGTLPFPIKEVKDKNPRVFILFGKPKTGKTTIAAQLENSLTIELEKGGADFIGGSVIEVNNLAELGEVGKKIKEHGKPYRYIIVDTITKLEDIVLPLAAQMYKNTPMGKNWLGKDVKTLPKGAGYLYLRKAFFQVLDEIQSWGKYTILIGHLKDNLIEKNGEEFTSKELELTGKIKSLLSAQSDAIAFYFRKGNEGFLNFSPTEDTVAGCRSPHLEGQVIKISKKNEKSGEVETNWNEIFKFNK